ncbi:asialoglycoprotein receptor-like 1 [Denticeps clupeoides]|uniref:asialoglycoprotein receptor-like 1 n=1 Tax=Denticeps clupeoides TaxID=299321 RepID=UPI0010A57C2F|nr:hepatic lectin-like [Denticeps clupeoides]
METVGYDQFGASDSQNRFTLRGRRTYLAYVLYSVLLLLLLILMLITGVKFSQLGRDISEMKSQLTSASAGNLPGLPSAQKDSPTELPVVQGDCHEGWVEFQRHCYYTSKQKANWHLAEQRCIQQEALLFVPNSEEEMNFVSKVVRLRFGYWMGLVEREAEGNWTFVDGTDYNSVPHFWDPGQPDDWDVKVNGEDCGQLHPIFTRRRMGWNDADCTLSFLYVCEHELKAKG